MSDDEESSQTEFGGAIETPRLTLLPLRLRAAAAAFTGTPLAGGVAALLRPRPGGFGEAFAIVEERSGGPIGAAGYGPMLDRPERTEVGCWIDESHRGFGYATEVAHAVIDRVFADTTIAMLWCVNRVMNAEGRRVIEKCGFQFRETGMARSPTAAGAVPVDRFALDRRNWVALRRWGVGPGRKHGNGEIRDTAA